MCVSGTNLSVEVFVPHSSHQLQLPPDPFRGVIKLDALFIARIVFVVTENAELLRVRSRCRLSLTILGEDGSFEMQ